MRTRSYLLFLFIFVFFNCIPFHANAYLLEEQEIPAKNNTCRIRYLTEKNIKGWYIVSNQYNCPNDGWLDGYHDITIFNAFSQVVERIYGYFSSGYWTGDAFVSAPFLTRFSEELGVQKATFLLAKDDENDMDFIGQMVAKKNKEGDYSSFHVCNPFKLLIVTEQIPVFANKKKQQLIFREIAKQVRTICPTEEKVMLFVSPIIEPRQEDIVFYSEINLKNHTSKNTWQEDALKKSGYYNKTIEVAHLENIFEPNTQDLDELRKALSKKIDLLPFKSVTDKSHPSNFNELNKIEYIKTNNDSITDIPDLENEETIIKKSTTVTFTEEEIPTTEIEKEIKSLKSEDFIFPTPQKNYVYKESNNGYLSDPIMNLIVLSKIKKQPVKTAFVAHIKHSTNKYSISDFPVKLKLKGKPLEKGWYKVKGQISTDALTDDIYANIKVHEIKPCTSNFCTEDK